MQHHHPTFQEFSKHARDGRLVPVYRQLVGDTLTPVTAYRKIQWGTCSFLFESVVGGEKIGRYSFLGSDPFFRLEAFGNDVVETRGDKQTRYRADDPLNVLADRLQEYRAVPLPGLPRFCGGAVGYAGYDVVRYSEHLPSAPTDDRQLPDLSFSFYDRMVVFDQINKTVQVVAHARTDGPDLRADYDRACTRVDEICRQLQQDRTISN